jgi:UDP-N-acetylmuramoyl-tripeptide--D-alanyl-D-alanine ligase
MKEIFKKIVIKVLTWEAKVLLRRKKPKIIAITGSVGKTSTKDAVYWLLKDKFDIRASEKSFNSEIGVPLTVLNLPNAWSNPIKWIWNAKLGFWKAFFTQRYPKVLVLEIGADKPGDISNTVAWAKPDIAVVTALADIPVHVANFPTVQDVYKEKGKLIEVLPAHGIAILNADDARVMQMRVLSEAKVLTFAQHNPADITPTDIHSPSMANVYPVLAAAAVALAMGVEKEDIKELTKNIATPKGRMNMIEGVNGSVIIDDSYNSSPIATEAALNTLKNWKLENTGHMRRIAALGDMRELGELAEQAHRQIGKLVPQCADMLITVGPLSKWLAESACEAGMPADKIFEFKANGGSREAGKFLKDKLVPGDVVLVKGSQNTIRMEWLIEEIMAHPKHKKDLLVRQDEEWAKH